jgi:tetratricopeptide (TPR) repeat protein
MRTFFSLTVLLLSFISNAQKVDCSLKTKEYQDFIIALDFEQALSSWETVQKNCPKQSEELYTDGQKILQFKIDNAQSPEEKEKLVRQAIKVYDQFNKNFPLASQDFEIKKAILLLNNNVASEDEILSLLNNGFKNASDKITDANAIFSYFKLNVAKLKKEDKTFTIDDVLEKYFQTNALLSKLEISNPGKKEDYQAALRRVKIEGRAVATCENLTAYLEKRLPENSENPSWLATSLKVLITKCSSQPIFMTLASKLYLNEVTAESAGFIALASLKNRNFEDAKKYYEQAAELETNPSEKANIYYNTAVGLYSSDLINSKKQLEKALKADPKFVKAYMFLAQLYSNNAEKCGKTPFEKKAIHNLAIYTANKVLAIDPKMRTNIESLTTGFSKKALTMDEIAKAKLLGKKYTITGCDINETFTFPDKK